MHHIVHTRRHLVVLAVAIRPVEARDNEHGDKVTPLVNDDDARLLHVRALAGPEAALLCLLGVGLGQDALQPLLFRLWHNVPVAEEESARIDVARVVEHLLGVDEEEGVGIDEDDLAEARDEHGVRLGSPT